jgi:hypothetical protein
MYGDGICLDLRDKPLIKALLDHDAAFFKKADRDSLNDIIYDFDADSYDDWFTNILRTEIYGST